MIEMKIFNTKEDIAEYTFDLLSDTAGKNKNSAAALSFGSTYEDIFREWRNIFIKKDKPALPALFPADERLVDLKDPGSNWGKARTLFLDECGSAEDIGRWPSDSNSYRQLLADFFSSRVSGSNGRSEELPEFDLVFLGIGPDGHTASLFPGQVPHSGMTEWYEPVLQTESPFPPAGRLTLGPGVIAKARKVVFTVTGAGKAGIFNRFISEILCLTETKAKNILPPSKITAIREEQGLETLVVYDRSAAQEIQDTQLR